MNIWKRELVLIPWNFIINIDLSWLSIYPEPDPIWTLISNKKTFYKFKILRSDMQNSLQKPPILKIGFKDWSQLNMFQRKKWEMADRFPDQLFQKL
jgi:hypothetical protein